MRLNRNLQLTTASGLISILESLSFKSYTHHKKARSAHPSRISTHRTQDVKPLSTDSYPICRFPKSFTCQRCIHLLANTVAPPTNHANRKGRKKQTTAASRVETLEERYLAAVKVRSAMADESDWVANPAPEIGSGRLCAGNRSTSARALWAKLRDGMLTWPQL